MEINNSPTYHSAPSSLHSGIDKSRSVTTTGEKNTVAGGFSPASLNQSNRENNKTSEKNTSLPAVNNTLEATLLDEQPKKSRTNQEKQSFLLDESKIAIIESHQSKHQTTHQSLQSNTLELNEQASLFSQKNQQDYKEQLSPKNQTAVSTYAKIDNLAQRENVQKLFGVDLFA